MAYIIPSDANSAGSGNPAGDMNHVADVLTGMNAANNVLNYGADPANAITEAAQSAAFQNAINALPAGGGAILVPPGTYSVHGLNPVPGLRLFSWGYGCCTLTTASGPMFVMDQGAGNQLDYVEIDHMTLTQTGGYPIFSGMYVTRSSVHHCLLQALNAGASIWLSNSGTGYMAECRFYENREQVTGTSRTWSPWYLACTNVATLYQVNDNTWHDNVCFNNSNDQAQPWYHLAYASSAFPTVTCNANTFRDIVWEFPTAGMIWLESCAYTSLERLTCEDLAALAVGNPMIHVTKNANGGAPQNTRIRNYSRRGGSAGGLIDVQLASTAINTLIDAPVQMGGGTALTLDLGSSSLAQLANMPGTYTLSNAGSGVWAPMVYGQLSSLLPGGGTISSGTGAPAKPNGANPAAGDWYQRTDTPSTGNQRLYVCTTGGGSPVWSGIA